MNTRQNKERKFWNKFAKHYDLFIKKTQSEAYESIFKNLNLDLNSNHKALEIGTGTGLIPFVIHSKVSSITATDISPEMIRIAKKRQEELNIQNIDFQVQDCYELKIPNNSFDVVIASNLLHLLYNVELPLNEIKRVLKKDGFFITPTFCVGESMKSKIISNITGFLSGFKIINKWSFNEFKNILSSHGFKIEKELRIESRFPLIYLVLKKQ